MTDYAYFNARIRAMQGRLLSPAEYESLLNQDDVAGVVGVVAKSAYAEALFMTSDALPDAQRLDEAFQRDLCQHVGKVRYMARESQRVLLDAVLLRWDAENIKVVLRGKRINARMEELLTSAVPVGRLDDVAIAELMRAPSIRAVADLLETWRILFGRSLRGWLQRHGESDSLLSLEVALDHLAFSEGLRDSRTGDEQGRMVEDYLKFLADQVNLLLAFRFLVEGRAAAVEMYFLDVGGRITRPVFQAIVSARDLRQGLDRLGGSPYAWLAQIVHVGDGGEISVIERALREALIHEATSLAIRDSLGVGVAIAYVERKVNEVRNLRLITRGKAIGATAEQIRRWLIVEW